MEDAMRRSSGRAVAALFVLSLAAGAWAQKEKREPLNPAQIEQIREATINPNERLELYAKFLNERSGRIQQLTARVKSEARARRIDNELQDFTALMDELATNLDQFSDRKADIRKALRIVTEAAPKWLAVLHGLAGEPGFELARKEALESADDLSAQATRLLSEQTEYFRTHKDEQGQDRVEPKE